MKCCGTQTGCRSRFSATNASFVNARRTENPIFRRSSDLCLWKGLQPSASVFGLPGITPVTGFRLKNSLQHLQRRYRSGFSPDYLVQQAQPYAMPATELVSSCRGYCSTYSYSCQLEMDRKRPLEIATSGYALPRNDISSRGSTTGTNTAPAGCSSHAFQNPGNCLPAGDT